MSFVPRPHCGRASARKAAASAKTRSTPFSARRPEASNVSSLVTSFGSPKVLVARARRIDARTSAPANTATRPMQRSAMMP